MAVIEKMIAATLEACGFEAGVERMLELNRGKKLQRAVYDPTQSRHLNLSLQSLLREKRNAHRKKRRYRQGPKLHGWTTYNKIPGAKRKYISKLS